MSPAKLQLHRAPQVRPLIHKEPAWLIAPFLTKIPSQVICSGALQLPLFSHVANTRPRLQDVHHPKMRVMGQMPSPEHRQSARAGCRWVQEGGPWQVWEKGLVPQSTLEATVSLSH